MAGQQLFRWWLGAARQRAMMRNNAHEDPRRRIASLCTKMHDNYDTEKQANTRRKGIGQACLPHISRYVIFQLTNFGWEEMKVKWMEKKKVNNRKLKPTTGNENEIDGKTNWLLGLCLPRSFLHRSDVRVTDMPQRQADVSSPSLPTTHFNVATTFFL